MQIRTFLGTSTQSILAQVKEKMGPDAIILSSREVEKDGVRLQEVTAGVEHTPIIKKPENKISLFSLKEQGKQLVTPNRPQTGYFESSLVWRQWHKEWLSLRDHILALLKPELHMEQLTPRYRLALEYLQKEGVDDEVIILLYRNLLDNKEQSFLTLLGEVIKTRPWGFNLWKNKLHLIAGPYGVGKTVTALRFVLLLKEEKPEAKIAIINADCERGQGRLILKHYCELLDIIYHEASSAVDLGEILRLCRAADRIIIDLPGVSNNETLPKILKNLGLLTPLDLHLVLSPHYAPTHIRTLLTTYASERTSSIVWTKLDEALSFGAIANIAVASSLPVSAISFAPGLTGSLLPADNPTLWRILFKHQLPGKLPEVA